MYNNPNYPGYPNQGYAYSVARPQPANPQVLTEDQVAALKQNASEFNMKIDQLDLYRAICAHRDPRTGAMTVTIDNDGMCTCSICGETFHIFDGNENDVKEAADKVKDIMQTAKLFYMDAPRSLTENYYQQIALLNKLPGLWKHSANNFAKYENVSNPLNPVSGNYSGFGALNTLLTAPYNMYYGQQVAPAMAQPMMPTQQMGANMAPPAGFMPQQMAAQPMFYDPNMANPMAFGQPVMAPAQQTAAPAQQTVAPAPAPAPQNEVQQQKVYNV